MLIFNSWHKFEGELVYLEPNDPAVGASYNYTLPGTNLRYEILNVYVQLDTDANVANRQLIFRMQPAGVGNIVTIPSPLNQVANTIYNYSLPKGSPIATWVQVGGDVAGWFPNRIILDSGDNFQLTAFNLQATDQFQNLRIQCLVWRA